MKSVSFATVALAAVLAVPVLAADTAPVHKANGVLVDSKGMTVYTFDKDSGGKSTCTGSCSDYWPPVQAGAAPLSAPYSAVTRDDGSKQLAYKGKPLYRFSKDKSPGDKKGDKVMENQWHVVTD